jgi:pilus assembly protein Flp/PilA
MATRIASVLGWLPSDDDGQGLAEYALILALIAVLAIIALLFLGSQISDRLSEVGNAI